MKERALKVIGNYFPSALLHAYKKVKRVFTATVRIPAGTHFFLGAAYPGVLDGII